MRVPRFAKTQSNLSPLKPSP